MHADDGYGDGGGQEYAMHVSSSEDIAKQILDGFVVNKVYLPDYPVVYQTGGVRTIPKASEELLYQINIVGNSCYFFTGHGNRNTLTHERTFTREMISQFNNADKLFFFAAFSCEVGRFDNLDGTLASEMVVLPTTGAIGSFAASRVSGAGTNSAIAERFTRNMLSKNKFENNTIGQASLKTKRSNDNSSENFMYILFGDPALKLLHPELNVVPVEINGVILADSDSNIVLKGMSVLNIKGKICFDGEDEVIDNLNGHISISLTNPKIDAEVFDERNTQFRFVKNGETLNSTVAAVVNGEFEANLFIPGEISFSSKNSILYFYANGTDETNTLQVNKT